MNTEKRNKCIQEKAIATTTAVAPWQFEPRGHLYVDDKNTNSYVGELYYRNPNYETGGAIKVQDWVFVLERMTSEAPDTWVIAAFHGHLHYSFTEITASNQSELNNLLVKYVVTTYWPILYPEVFTDYLHEQSFKDIPEDKQVTWRLIPL